MLSNYNENYIHTLINSLENSVHRAKYYRDTGDIRFLNESNEWIIVSSIYFKELTKENTNESFSGL